MLSATVDLGIDYGWYQALRTHPFVAFVCVISILELSAFLFGTVSSSRIPAHPARALSSTLFYLSGGFYVDCADITISSTATATPNLVRELLSEC